MIFKIFVLYEKRLYPPKRDELLSIEQLELKDGKLFEVMLMIEPFKSIPKGEFPIRLGLVQSTETFLETHPLLFVMFGIH